MLVGGGFLVFRFQSFPVVSSRFQWFLSSKCRHVFTPKSVAKTTQTSTLPRT
uniref:Uncharacterized protein n=1 Tax=Siphoviridae sp. ctbvo1 TaxID=2823590 RepID=A0A8S5L8V9_9CAUD|nr:MAG TPA: hypothetical protein [Siphoviridae sp. ctbvo1]